MTTPYKGKYSQSINHSHKKRYYVMQAQRNVPLIDAELRELSQSNLDLINWANRNNLGDVAVIQRPYSNGPEDSSVNNAFKVVPPTTASNTNFKILGGQNSNGINDNPAVMYLKGYYVFLSKDIEYTDQGDNISGDKYLDSSIKEYPGEVLPSASSSDEEKLEYVTRHDAYVKGGVPPLTASESRTDIVYVELTLEEVVAGTNPSSAYIEDPSLKDEVVGNASANRVKAVVKFLVEENWSGATDGLIFEDSFFNEAFDDNGVKYLRAPIAIINRSSQFIEEENLIDLLHLHDKRIFPAQEITHRLRHGGYTQRDVDSGRAVSSDVDEKWGATGLNEGISTEAFNTNSVTPRVINKSSDFRMQSLALAGIQGDQGLTGAEGTLQPDPDGLLPGELTTKKVFLDKLYIGSELEGSRKTIEEARSKLNGRSIFLDNAFATGAMVEAHTHYAGTTGPDSYPIDNHLWTQTSTGPWGTKTLSELTNTGSLALGKEYNGLSGYQLDVGNPSNFDDHVDFRGGTNHFWNNVGVSGVAGIYNAEWDHQSYKYSAPENTEGSVAYWKICSVLIDNSRPSISFTLNVSATSDGVSIEERHSRFRVKIGLTKEIVALDSHNFLKKNLRLSLIDSDVGYSEWGIFIQDEDYGQSYSYSATDTVAEDLTVIHFYDTLTTSWSTILEGTPEDIDFVKYQKSHHALLRAERTSFHKYIAPVSTDGTEYIYNFAGSSNTAINYSQAFTIVVKDPDQGRLHQSFRLKVHKDPESNEFLTVSDHTAPARDELGQCGIYEIVLSGNAGSNYLSFKISETLSGGDSSLRGLIVEISEDPDFGNGVVDTPFVLVGSEDTTTTLAAPATSSEITTLKILEPKTLGRGDVSSASLITNSSIALKSGGVLDLHDKEADSNPALDGPTITDLSGRTPNFGEVLSGGVNGLKWSSDTVLVVRDIASLRNLNPQTSANKLIFVEGYYAPRDLGHGFVTYDENETGNDDSCYLFAYQENNTNPGRYRRVLEGQSINVFQCGVPSDGVTASSSSIQNASYAAALNKLNLRFPAGSTFNIDADVTFSPNVHLNIDSKVSFYTEAVSRPTIAFRGPTYINNKAAMTHPTDGPELYFLGEALTEVYPEWWGVTDGSSVDNTDYFNDMYTSLSRSYQNSAVPSRFSDSKGITVVISGHRRQEGPNLFEGFYHISGVVEMTSPTKFSGSGGVFINNGAHWDVMNEIVASNQRIFGYDLNDFATAGGYGQALRWRAGAPAKVNVTWLGVESLPALAATDTIDPDSAPSTFDSLYDVFKNFEGQESSITLFFPPGHYNLQTSPGVSVYDLVFNSDSIKMAPGAYFFWRDTRVKFPKIEDTSHPIFDFNRMLNSSDKDIVRGPVIGGGVIRLEWFNADIRDVGNLRPVYADRYALTWALSSLLETCRYGDDRSPYFDTEDVKENSYTFLDGGGRVCIIGEQVIPFFPRSTSSEEGGYARYLGVRNINIVSGNTESDDQVLYTGNILKLGNTNTVTGTYLRDLDIVNCRFKGNLPPSLGVRQSLLEFGRGSSISFKNSEFRNLELTLAGTSINDIKLYSNNFYSCYVDANSSVTKAHRNNFYDTSTGSYNFTEYSLSVGSQSIIEGNTFSWTTASNSEILSAQSLYLGLAVGSVTRKGVVVANNTFINAQMNVPSNSIDGIRITGNYFLANYDGNYSSDGGAVANFINLQALSPNSKIKSGVITGNTFECSVTPVVNVANTSSGKYTAYEAVYEAINVVEDETNYFNDEEIYDFIVKDNVGSLNVNIRSTELTESRIFDADTDGTGPYFVPYNRFPIYESSTSTEYSSFASKRLVGYPQEVNAYVQTSDSFNGWCSVSPTLFDEEADDFTFTNSPYRYRPFKIHAKNAGDAATSLTKGLPTGGVISTVFVSCKTYKQRQDAATFQVSPYQADNYDVSVVRVSDRVSDLNDT